jgi:pimeloyl-ACP methyl ester carboxylesterase
MSKKPKIKISDLQGLASILTDATVKGTTLVEDFHQRMVHPPFLPSTPIQHLITGISGVFYKTIRGATQLIGGGVGAALAQFDPQLDLGISFEKKGILRAIMNGVIGDYLVETENPLAIPMRFRQQGETLRLSKEGLNVSDTVINGKLLLMVHGLCMNDLQWQQKGQEHGTALAKELGLTPVYLHYNTGLHISANGQQFSQLLEDLVQTWPVPVESITIVAHSMGGLVTRSAFHYGKESNKTWTQYLHKIVFLGTPHHGAPLERIGNYVDRLLEAIPYVQPLARLGKMRSAGITDLRFGNLLETDWQDRDRFQKSADERTAVPLPENVSCYAIAASIAPPESNLKSRLLGDGMVRTPSALGQHQQPDKNLNFPSENTLTVYETSHMDLLSSAVVYEQMKAWLGPFRV